MSYTATMEHPCVLVVDPNPATLSRVQSALNGTAFEVIAARDAVEAEEHASTKNLSVVLSCTGLPRGNGYDLARTLLARHPDANVLLMSGGFEVYNRSRAEQSGVSGQISKPFSAEGLRQRLESLLGALPEASVSSAPAPSPMDTIRDMQPEQTDEIINDGYEPPLQQERISTFLPRDFQQVPAVGASVTPLEPALEAAMAEVLPEVVEAVIRRTLQSSTAFRDLVEVAVDEAVRAHLPEIARRVIRERIAEIEAYDD